MGSPRLARPRAFFPLASRRLTVINAEDVLICKANENKYMLLFKAAHRRSVSMCYIIFSLHFFFSPSLHTSLLNWPDSKGVRYIKGIATTQCTTDSLQG